MHVLITGGTGFIGRALCPLLRDCGYGLTVLTRDPACAAKAVPGVRLIERLDQAECIDAVVNLAGEPLAEGRWTDRRKEAFRQSRIGTTRNLLQWLDRQAPAARPRVLVSGSAIGYYGPRDDTPVSEDAPPGEDFAARLCRDWEAAAVEAEALGVRVARVRIGVVLGDDGGALAKMLPPFKLGAGGPMGSGEQWMSWVHRSDLARLVQWLLETGTAQGAYNGTAPEPARNREFAQALGKVLGKPAKLTTPALALRLMFGEMSGLLLTGQRVLPAKAQAEGFVFQHPRLEETLRDVLQARNAA
ncbi:MAG TPA: TIGR01777 family oxidoreductase [Pseudoxanthomonas sp.]|nr:TIGR01777 family oxidoreductase [Pseudoxanthomonas sp.]